MLFLSIVIPTFNRKDSLCRTLDGLARQDFPAFAFEVIVVSDGSTDGTDAFVESYVAPYALTLLTQTNSGPAYARNRGIEAAAGKVVVFLDDDVEPAPSCLSAHARQHMSQENAVVIGPMSPDPAYRSIEPSWIAWEHAMLWKQYAAWKSGEWTQIGPPNFYTGNSSVRRNQLLAVGGFDVTFARQEDVEMAWRLEREFHPAFIFDSSADALHRPRRSYASWLAVPYAYGRMDVVRARSGETSWEFVFHGCRVWHRTTQALARACLAMPGVAGPLRGALHSAAIAAYYFNADHAAFAALSVIYNLRYLDGLRAEMDRASLHRLLHLPSIDAEWQEAA